MIAGSRELDVQIAEKVMDDPCNCERCPSTEWCRRHGKGERMGTRFYSSSYMAANEVENRMLELRLAQEYAVALGQVLADGRAMRVTAFDYAHATPDQRCRAALAALSSRLRRGAAN